MTPFEKPKNGGIGNLPQKWGDSKQGGSLKKGGDDMKSSLSGQDCALFCTFELSMVKFAQFTMHFLWRLGHFGHCHLAFTN